MSISSQLEAVRAAEADVVLQHQRLKSHLHEMREVRDGLVTPGRIVITGLAVGFVVGRAAPALRNPVIRRDIREGTDSLQRLIHLGSTLMPVLLPLWTQFRSAHANPQDAPEPAAEHAPADAPPGPGG